MSGEGWEKCKLGDIAEIQTGPFGSQLHASDYVTEGIPVVMPVNIIDGYVSIDKIARVLSKDTSRLHKHKLSAGDVVFSRRGDVDKYAFVTEKEEGWLCGTGCLKVRCNSRNDSRFISYQLGLRDRKEWLRNHAVGTTMPNLNTTILSNLPIILPDLLTQTRITAILSALDDKIELNRQTNTTLDAIAQSIFKEWFVDFRFPGATGEMQDSELGPIPMGWKIYKLEELIDSVSATHKFTKDEVVFLNTSDIEAGKVLHQNYSKVKGLPGQAKKSIQKFDILFTEIRPANKRYALIDFDADDYVVSTKLMVLRVKSDIHPIVIYNYLTCPETLSWLQHLAESRSGTFPQITFNHVKELKLALPTTQLLAEYSNIAWANFQQVKVNEQQTAILSTTRDNLLPKLMSGEIEV